MGVLVYLNKDGKRCIAAGKPSNGSIVAANGAPGREIPVPLSQVGLCDLRLSPVAFQLEHSREGIVIFGMAAADVTRIEVEDGARTVTAVPSADDAFIMSIREARGRMVVHHQDGRSEVVPLPKLPDLDDLNRGLQEAAKEAGL